MYPKHIIKYNSPNVVFLEGLFGQSKPGLVQPFGFVANQVVRGEIHQQLGPIFAQMSPPGLRCHRHIVAHDYLGVFFSLT